MRKQVKTLWALCFSIIFAISAYSTSFAGNEITVCGTGDSQDLLRIMGKAFEKANPGTSIQVPESIGGIKETAAGNCDLGRAEAKEIINTYGAMGTKQ